jgi:CubicO group peptidase (beta-lactamase class C family)
MRRDSFFAATTLIVALASGGAAAQVAEMPRLEEVPEVAQRLRLFELWIGDQMAYLDQPGVAVGIVAGERLIWGRGFGYRDVASRAPMTTETVFRLGSISKVFTATAVLHLRDAGRLDLDDPVSRHLPWFRVRPSDPGEPPLSVRHLLVHTSGLPREADLPYWTDRRFPDREQLAAAVSGGTPLAEPGVRYRYSNLGIAVLGEVVAAAAGRSWDEVVRDAILEPLGMTSSAVRLAAVDRERLATGYLLRRPDGSWPVAPDTVAKALAPAASVASTVEDLARFVASQFYDREGDVAIVLERGTRREMHRVQWLAPSWSSGRGLGFSVWREGERTVVGHGGWVAGYRTQIAFDPEAGIGVIVLTNSDEGGPGSYVEQGFALVAPALDRAMHPPAEPPPLVEPERYVGAYHDPWGAVSEVLVLDGRLVIYDHGHPPSVDVLGGLTRLTAVAEHTFRRGSGELVVFETSDDGGVARVKVGANYLFPAGCGEIGDDLRCVGER